MLKILPKIVKLPKHKRFEYKPRYYNAQKEELSYRYKTMERNLKDNRVENSRIYFNKYQENNKSHTQKTNILILATAFAGSFFFLLSNDTYAIWKAMGCVLAGIIYVIFKNRN